MQLYSRMCAPNTPQHSNPNPTNHDAGTNKEPAALAGAAPFGCVVPVGRPECVSHTADSTSSHCFVTVDLDLASHYVRFFRNGHLIGSAFTNVVGPVAPTIAFTQVRCEMLCFAVGAGSIRMHGLLLHLCTISLILQCSRSGWMTVTCTGYWASICSLSW